MIYSFALVPVIVLYLSGERLPQVLVGTPFHCLTLQSIENTNRLSISDNDKYNRLSTYCYGYKRIKII